MLMKLMKIHSVMIQCKIKLGLQVQNDNYVHLYIFPPRRPIN